MALTPKLPDSIGNCLCRHWGRVWFLSAEFVGEFPRKHVQSRRIVAGIESASSSFQYEVFRSWPTRHTSFESLSVGGGVSIETFHDRSEERRVGKECRSRWSPHH